MESVFFRSISEPYKCPDEPKLINYSVQETEDGNREYVKSSVVAPSLASDFSVVNNSILRNNRSVSPVRDSIDPVDVPTRYAKTFKELSK